MRGYLFFRGGVCALVGFCQAVHKVGQVLRLRTYEVDSEDLRPLPSEQNAEDCEVRPVILEREFEMVAKRVSRPVPGRVDLFDDAFA